MHSKAQFQNEYPQQIYNDSKYSDYEATGYNNMGNAMNSSLPMSEMMPNRISAPQQFQQNSSIPMSEAMVNQSSDQRSSKRLNNLLSPNSKMLSKA